MSTIFTDYDGNLELVDQKYYILKHVPQECSILDFAKTIEDDNLHYGPGARCVIGIGPG